MKYVYHGSKISGLKEIEPRKSTHGKEWVYATKSKCIATIFLKNYGSDFTYVLSGKGTKENPAIIVERKPRMFEKMFSNGGSIYTLSGEDFIEGQTSWSAEVVTEKNNMLSKNNKLIVF